MKNIIFLIAIISFIGCKEEAPTEQKINLDKEYTLEELENDPDWVEVTDIDTTKRPCVWPEIREFGKLIRNMEDLRVVYSESDELGWEYSKFCFEADSLGVDFSSRSLIFYWIDKHPVEIMRKIFRNDKLKQYIYVAGLTGFHGDLVKLTFNDNITIPKVKESYSFRFDTLRVEG